MRFDVISYLRGKKGLPPSGMDIDSIVSYCLGKKASANAGTSAVLGKAILGQAILGKGRKLRKLGTPTIRLLSWEGPDAPVILDTPVIYLSTEDVPVVPDEPEIIKLDAPTIRLEEISDPGEEPGDDPVVTKLDAPEIYLEVIAEPEEPEVPDEPDEPEIAKLATPVISLETIESKNNQLFNVETVDNRGIRVNDGITYENDSWRLSAFIPCAANTDYCFSQTNKVYYQCAVVFYDADKNFIEGISYGENDTLYKTFRTPEEAAYMRVSYSVVVSGNAVDRGNLMLNEGTEPLPWEPYVETENPEISSRKQLLNMSGAKGGTSNGMTVEVYEDGSYLLTGTAELDYANVWLLGGYSSTKELFTLKAGRYYVSGVDLFSYDGTTRNVYRNAFVLAKETAITAVRVPTLEKGKTYNDRIYPMLNAGTEPLPWEPYDNSTNVEPEEPEVPELPKLDAPDVYIVEGEDITDQFTWHNNGGVQYNNGEIASSGILKYSDPVDVIGAEKITLAFMDLTAHDGNAVGYGLAFFDENDAHISGYNFQKGNTEPGKPERTILTIDVPEGAATMKTTYAMDEETYGAFFAYVVRKPAEPETPVVPKLDAPTIYLQNE